MRRVKLILAAALATAMLMVLAAAPALADIELRQGGGTSFSTDNGGGSLQSVVSFGGSSHGDIRFNGIDIDDNDDEGILLVGGASNVGG